MSVRDLYCWAKTTRDKKPGVDVFQHCLNVGHVALLIAKSRAGLMRRFELKPSVVAALAALHDIGKISQRFQIKCESWAAEMGVTEESVAHVWLNCLDCHGKISQFTVQNLLIDCGLEKKQASLWAVPVGAHHGIPYNPSRLNPTTGMSVESNKVCDAAWEEYRKEVAKRLIDSLGELPRAKIARDSPELWWLSGLISVADWIGSDEHHFSIDQQPDFDVEQSRTHAKSAVESIGLDRPTVREGLTFEDLFSEEIREPNDLQIKSLEVIHDRGIYVIEAPMGMGKTEAALACAYQLICEDKADGIYFALPTQTTSNRIHRRVQKFVEKICGQTVNARLIHANSWLVGGIAQPSVATTQGRDQSADARVARDWFTSPKRALLASFGVGTIDQALLSVVAAKHFFVRRFGLAGKVVILDEIHSYDFYTGTLIKILCETLENLGCTVILLSATLTAQRRADLLDESETSDDTRYPLISGRKRDGNHIVPKAAQLPKDKQVHIHFVSSDDALERAWEAATSGACIVWICNTVARAQDIYEQISVMREQQDNSSIEIGLLHSRFPHFKREELESYWMEALGKEGGDIAKRPHGCVLVSTQVVEQSVDLDADLLITELAPTDMLLQRIGRLWRHDRGARKVSTAECWLVNEAVSLDQLRSMSKKQIVDALGTKALVYAPYVLLRSLEVWAAQGGRAVSIPSKIRDLIRDTYEDREGEPQGWIDLKQNILGEEFAKKKIAEMNSNIWMETLDDVEGAQTRVSDIETVQLILATRIERKAVTLLNDDAADLSGDQFRVSDKRALHRNIVKVPKSAFAAFTKTELTNRYVKGKQALAIVGDHGRIEVSGLKDNRALYWSDKLGIEVRSIKKEKACDEPCD